MAKGAAVSSGRCARLVDDSVTECGESGNLMTTEFVLLLAIGFVAQLVDGTLGMAYGVMSNAALLTMGLPPAHASALVRRGFHHGGLGGFAHLSSQRGLADGGAPRRDRRAGRDPG